MSVDLATTYMGVPIKNPLIIGGGPTTATPEICEKAARVGWAGVVTKTNYPDEVLKIVPITVPRPYYGLVDERGVGAWRPIPPKVNGPRTRNGRRLGTLRPDYALTMSSIRHPAPFEKRTGIGLYFQGPERFTYYVDKTKELVGDLDCKVIASVAAFSEQGWEEQVRIVNQSKADMVELNFGCPTIGAMDDEATGGEWVYRAMGAYPTVVEKWTKYCTERIKVPVGAKLPPYAPFASVQAAIRGGAKGIQYGDAPVFLPEMPPVVIDVDLVQPGTFPGLPFTSGAIGAIFSLPYILGGLVHFRKNGITADVSGCGGVREALDVIRLLMAGATSVQVCTATCIEGVAVGTEYLDGMAVWMARKGYRSVRELIGIAATPEKLVMDISKAPPVGLPQVCGGPLPPEEIKLDRKKCIGCAWCAEACFHLAIEMKDEKPAIDQKLCEVCGMCVAVCPVRSLSIGMREGAPA